MVEVITIAQAGEAWAVKHRGGILGHASSYEEATFIARDLMSWLRGQGRAAELRTAELAASEPRSFAPQRRRANLPRVS
jgi:hypothetical protein